MFSTSPTPTRTAFHLQRNQMIHGITSEYKSDEWSVEDRSVFDKGLSRLARIPIEDRRPRNATGQVFVWKEGNVVVVRRNETLDRVFKKLSTLLSLILRYFCAIIDFHA